MPADALPQPVPVELEALFNGAIGVFGTLGEGTRFTVVLPRAARDQPEPPPDSYEPSGAAGRGIS
jgi:hypothetical protein